MQDVVRIVEFSARLAVIAQRRAVQLKNIPAARLLVQAVDVLRHDRAQLALALPAGERLVRGVRLHIRRKQLFPVEPVKIVGMRIEKVVAQDGFRRIIELLVIKSVHTPEIRDAGLGRHARTAEEDNITTFGNPGS